MPRTRWPCRAAVRPRRWRRCRRITAATARPRWKNARFGPNDANPSSCVRGRGTGIIRPDIPLRRGATRKTIRDIPGTHTRAVPLLVAPGLRAVAALRHGDGRRHVPYRDVSARYRSGAVAGGVRAALAPPQGRPPRRQPQSPAALLSVSSRPQAVAGEHPGALPRLDTDSNAAGD